MSKESSKLVDKAIREILAPVLHADGFRGSGRTFRRVRGELVHVFHVQGSRRGGELFVNLGVHLRFLTYPGDHPVSWEKIQESECFLRQRMSESGPGRSWRHEGDEASITAAIQSIQAVYQSNGQTQFERFARYPESFANIVRNPIQAGPAELGRFECSRGVLHWARIRMEQGDFRGAIALARRDLQFCSESATIYRNDLEQLQAAAQKVAELD